ncbi:hypothetical protein E0Z10_g1390 [Xylaria hypoxylon]|uniref:Eukaryotic translation initiation factor 5A n=1 Tax=Xylaria hypoxylon TaxID=37992 RepID=A0A4Z0ZEY1_9PEZI|nr:hypothetical protein E0Z10_g1390 [Xylaria hypoxylon]
MADEELQNQDFSTADAEGSLTKPVQCSALRKGGFVNIKGRPCKIVEMSTSKTGKHGHAKVHLVATDIFTGKKLEELCPSTHNMDVPNHKSITMTLLHLNDDFLGLMDSKGAVTENEVRIPDGDLGEVIRNFFDPKTDDFFEEFADKEITVTVTKAMGETHVTQVPGYSTKK